MEMGYGGKHFPNFLSTKPSSGAHSFSYTMGTGSCFPRGMKLTTHPHLVPESRKEELYLYSLICPHVLLIEHRNNFTLPLHVVAHPMKVKNERKRVRSVVNKSSYQH
jgi:hypothetical protein